jgi:adenosyl cobinamide kinase/adenosyl cobinamide phosphate guanylyltransferase
MSCQSKKQELVDKLSIVACQDTKDMIDNHANTLVPFLGKMLLDLAVKEEFKNNVMCDCLTPFIKNYLNENYQEAELDNMLIDKGLRGKAIKKALAQNSTNIFQCYEKKGLKSLKLLKNFIEKAIH